MKKVALVPLLYNEYNYGGVLQFLALQKTLEKTKIQCEILKVADGKRIRDICGVSLGKRINRFALNAALKIRRSAIKRKLSTRLKKTDEFKRKYFLKEVSFSKDAFYYDAIICGSDQIWNPRWAKERTFLNFVPNNATKIIYSASMGGEELTEDDKKIFSALARDIDFVSVREKSAQNQLMELFPEKNVALTLDPTLLLEKEEWERLCADSGYDNYALSYFISDATHCKDRITLFAEAENLMLIDIEYASAENLKRNGFGDARIRDACPGEFLGLIKNASIVITDSYHACIFSFIFGKRVRIFKRSDNQKMSERMLSLLQLLNAEQHLTNDFIEIDASNNTVYENICKALKKHKQESVDYLINALGMKADLSD